MWVYTRPKSEHENGILINLDQSSRANMSRLGEKWFIEVTIGTEAFPVAQVTTQDEALGIMKRIFDGLHDGALALDLSADPDESEKAKREMDIRPSQNDAKRQGRKAAA